MVYRETDYVRSLKERARTAVSLAMEGRWAEAEQLNREVLEDSPDNLEALNRLGKALLELGRPEEALDAFRQALAVCPDNPIAAKNAARLGSASSAGAPCPAERTAGGGVLTAKAFIGDSGKSAEVTLLASGHAGNPSPGTPVILERRGGALAVKDEAGNPLGLLPLGLARRLLCLMDGGNRYDGAVSSAANGAVRVVLREAHQHPSQRSKLSFPPSLPASAPQAVESAAPGPAASEPIDAAAAWAAAEAAELELAGVGAAIDGAALDGMLLPELPDVEESLV